MLAVAVGAVGKIENIVQRIRSMMGFAAAAVAGLEAAETAGIEAVLVDETEGGESNSTAAAAVVEMLVGVDVVLPDLVAVHSSQLMVDANDHPRTANCCRPFFSSSSRETLLPLFLTISAQFSSPLLRSRVGGDRVHSRERMKHAT